MSKNLTTLKKRILDFKNMRKRLNDLKDNEVPQTQREIIAMLKTVDPEGVGVVIEFEGREEAAFVQQNDGTTYWDSEEIIAYLRKRVAGRQEMWRACSSRTFDVAKWEAEIANGNIPPKLAAKFKKTAPAPKPFIRFGKPTKDSLR